VFRVFLQLLSEKILILRRTELEMIKKTYMGLHVKYKLFLSDVSGYWPISTKHTSFKLHQRLSCRSL